LRGELLPEKDIRNKREKWKRAEEKEKDVLKVRVEQ